MIKTVQRLMKQYPDKIEEYSLEGKEDGYWLYLKPGWKREPHDEVHAVHEWNAKDLIAAMKLVVPCDCGECRTLAAEAGKSWRVFCDGKVTKGPVQALDTPNECS